MKKTVAVIAALLLAFVFAAPHMPVAAAEDSVSVPEGYDAHDYLLVRAFLETCDELGVKNGERLNEAYDPDDPTTWVYLIGGYINAKLTFWTETVPMRLTSFKCAYLPCVGPLSLADCTSLGSVRAENTRITSLDLSGCSALTNVNCPNSLISGISLDGCTNLKSIDLRNNAVEHIELSGNTRLSYVNLNDNRIPEFAVENCPQLRDLRLANNLLTELDLSGLGELRQLNVNGNNLTELDFSSTPHLNFIAACGNSFTELDMNDTHSRIREVKAVGPGTVGVENYFYEDISETPSTVYVHAVPAEGFRFAGWFNGSGELISDEADFGGLCEAGLFGENGEFVYIPDPITLTGETFFAARFVPEDAYFILGDCDGSGEVGATDALLALRCAMGISETRDDMLVTGDMNANGVIDTMDALIILRLALGI